MPIERLVYNEDPVNPNPYNLRYEDKSGKRFLVANEHIGEVFGPKGKKYMEQDRIMHSSIFRMGWNTAVVFEKQTNGPLKLDHVYDITTHKEKDIQNLSGIPFKQITTQAIDTCTLFYIETDKECLFAHFNLTEVVNFIEMLEGEGKVFSFTSPINYVFYSGGGVSIYSDEKENTRAAYNKLVQWMKNKKFIVFDRMESFYAERGPQKHYFSHMEFGINWNGSTAAYFGDIVYRGTDIPKPNECPCFIFECSSIDELIYMREWAKIVSGSDVGLNVDSLKEVAVKGPCILI